MENSPANDQNQPNNDGVISNLFCWFCCSTCLTPQHFHHSVSLLDGFSIRTMCRLSLMCRTLSRNARTIMMDEWTWGLGLRIENLQNSCLFIKFKNLRNASINYLFFFSFVSERNPEQTNCCDSHMWDRFGKYWISPFKWMLKESGNLTGHVECSFLMKFIQILIIISPGKRKLLTERVTSEGLISALTAFAAINHNREINIYMLQIPVERATLSRFKGTVKWFMLYSMSCFHCVSACLAV